MKKTTSDDTRVHVLIQFIGMTALALLIMVSVVGASPYTYITNAGSNIVSVIDTATNNVTASVNVGSDSYGVVGNPEGTKVYVTSIYSNTVYVIETATNTVTASVNVGGVPYGIAINPAGAKVYVASYGTNTVSVIDTARNTVTSRVNVGSGPFGVAVTPDGTKVYVANSDDDTVSIIDTATNTVTETVSVGASPHGIAIMPDGTRVYVTNMNSSDVSVIDTATNTVTGTVRVDRSPFGVAVNPAGTKVYVGNKNKPDTINGTVSVIDTATNTVTAIVIVRNTPEGIAVSPDGKKVYVARYENSSVSVIDTATNTVTDSVFIGGFPCAWGQFIVALPTVSLIITPLEPIPVGTNIKASAFVTPGSLDAFTGEWDWGDGNTSQSQVSSQFESSHVYSSVGIYTINFTVTDADGRSEIKEAPNYVVVYDPEGGFVTGGGWINSPAGAYAPDSTLAGKATFGFVSKYEKGATVPTGKTEFQFKVASLNFKSTSYDWLVVAGSQAKYKGTGTINGKGNYGFMLSAVDGAIKGDGIDKFRIKIWDKESNDIIYDNEIGIAEDTEPSTSIGGGSIVIHKEK